MTTSRTAIWDGLTIPDYNANNTDANRKGFFLNPTQRKTYDVDTNTLPDRLGVVLETVFNKSVADAIRLINVYIHYRLQLLPNGFQDLIPSVKVALRLAVYKQVEFTQYNRGNLVEIQNDTQYSQGTQTSIAVGADSSIYADDRLCLDTRALIDATGITEEGSEWLPLVSNNI